MYVDFCLGKDMENNESLRSKPKFYYIYFEEENNVLCVCVYVCMHIIFESIALNAWPNQRFNHSLIWYSMSWLISRQAIDRIGMRRFFYRHRTKVVSVIQSILKIKLSSTLNTKLFILNELYRWNASLADTTLSFENNITLLCNGKLDWNASCATGSVVGLFLLLEK